MARLVGVRYRRAGTIRSALQNPSGISRNAIAALPSVLRAELHEAVLSLDVNRISLVVQKIAEHNADLGATLALYAEKYAFTPILKAIETETGVTQPSAGT
jgi:hypothetical protein